MVDHYDFDDIEPEEETEAQKRFKRISKIVISIMLILMMFTFIVPLDVVFSLLASEKVTTNEVELGEVTIMFKNDVLDELKQFFLDNQMTEMKACLTGEVADSTYKVDSFYIPEIHFKTPISVSSALCNQETIITLHTHPFRNCLFSYQDITSYMYYKRINPKAMTAVMCDLDRFAFYRG